MEDTANRHRESFLIDPMIEDNRKIGVLDFGGQYAHLIAARIRRLGAYSEIVIPDSLTAEEAHRRFTGLVFSGGPSSVYDSGTPRSDPDLLTTELPILGICYGFQLMMKQLGARVLPAGNREYGPARLRLERAEGLFAGEEFGESQVWMSHGDEVASIPEGYVVLGSTEDCPFAAVGHPGKAKYGLQFHPEVTDTPRGEAYLRNFIRICGLENTWRLDDFLDEEIRRIREQVGGRKVFFLVSGGVDSTVAYTLLARALPSDHLRGLLVDTGFMRQDEIEEVRSALTSLGVNLEIEDASDEYFRNLKGVVDPEKKRNIIGELFVDIQERVSGELKLNPEEWYLGQGTIYPDRIESGVTAHSHRIKTHHNRVSRIREMLRAGRVVEPIRELYKDEVRRLGMILGLPRRIVERHPFPGPGLAVRCLCLDEEIIPSRELRDAVEKPGSTMHEECRQRGMTPFVLPVRSVGVQGDQRTYSRPVLLVPEEKIKKPAEWEAAVALARLIPNRLQKVNRVLYYCAGRSHPTRTAGDYRSSVPSHPTPERLDLLRRADHIVTEFLHEKGLYDDIWQFPVVLVPVRFVSPAERSQDLSTQSIILRPVCSTEAMTASAYLMDPHLLAVLSDRLLAIKELNGVFYDLTSKPPGTIEWE